MTGTPMRTPAILLSLLGCLALAAQADAAFVPALDSPFPASVPTEGIAVADADRNGIVDVVSDGLTLRRGDGTGRLGGQVAIGSSSGLTAPVAGDFNGDAWIDYAAIEPGMPGDPDRVLLFTAQPGAGYLLSVPSEDVGEASRLVAGDVDRDGRHDLVVGRTDPDSGVTVLRSSATGWIANDDHPVGPGTVEDLALGDFTGDGWLDVVAGSSAATVSLLANDRDGTFTPLLPISTGGGEPVDGLAVADFNGDGRLDAAATEGQRIALLRGNGAGGLTPFGRSRPTGASVRVASLAVGDVNADGRVDVAAGGATDSRVAVLLGDGRGNLVPTLGSPFSTGGPIGGEVAAVTVADMNRDGQADLVAANRPGSVAVLLNANTGLLEAIPRSVGIGPVPARSAPRTYSVTLRSVRGRLRISRVAITAASRAFTVAPGDCLGRTMLVGQSCAVTLRFKAPKRAERLEALLSVDANAAAVVVPLTATIRAPVTSRLRLRPKVLSLRPKAGRRRGRSRPMFMRLRYALSEDARVRVRIERVRPGRRTRAKRCVPPRPANRKRRRCRIWEVVGAVRQARVAGPNSMRIAARSAGRPLAAGRYRLSVSAADRFRNRSEEKTIAFRVRKRVR